MKKKKRKIQMKIFFPQRRKRRREKRTEIDRLRDTKETIEKTQRHCPVRTE